MLKIHRSLFVLSILLIFSMPVFAQDEEILLSIGDSEITKAEFEHIYRKNNTNLFNEAEKKNPDHRPIPLQGQGDRHPPRGGFTGIAGRSDLHRLCREYQHQAQCRRHPGHRLSGRPRRRETDRHAPGSCCHPNMAG